MSITAGVISVLAQTDTTANLAATAASGGSGPYTYQWYRSETSGFTPGGGNILAGKTALTLNDTGLIPGTTYFYEVIATDTGHSNDVADYNQVPVLTDPPALSQNQFAQVPLLGTIDMRFDYDTISVQVDQSQDDAAHGAIFFGSAVKVVDSADGLPKVVNCDADNDPVFGFVNFDMKTIQFTKGALAEISQDGNVIWLYATGAIARGAQVTLDVSTRGAVQSIANATSGDTIVGWAFDKATAAGQLIRVRLTCPSFQVKA